MYFYVMKRILFLFFSILVLSSCRKDVVIPEEFDGFVVPPTFPAPSYKFENNPVTQAGFELGRKIFYDPQLSRDNTISCGSCHLQSSAFAQVDHAVSHGVDNKLGTRNAPAIQNMAWQSEFFWDGGVHDLDLFSFAPIANPVEMDEKVSNVLVKMQNSASYPTLFEKAFGSKEINSTRMMQALSQFMTMLISANSRYDQYVAGNSSVLNADEVEGLAIFRNKCANCHTEPLFTDNAFRNNGLDKTGDLGRYRITLNEADKFKFKVPSLRNVQKTYPYMHNGKMATLEKVLDHYQKGIIQSPTLDPQLALSLNITDQEKIKIIAFLKTLTDDEFIRKPAFSEQ